MPSRDRTLIPPLLEHALTQMHIPRQMMMCCDDSCGNAVRHLGFGEYSQVLKEFFSLSDRITCNANMSTMFECVFEKDTKKKRWCIVYCK